MHPEQQDRDIAILHLTDLHFPAGSDLPFWIDPMAVALRRLASDRTVEIFAMAVTGDIADGPDIHTFQQVRGFLEESAQTVAIRTPQGEVDWRRIWIVDGDHDYRVMGLGRWWAWEGIQEGNFLTRLDHYPDPERRFLVLGLNSSKSGKWARGRMDLADLRTFQRTVETPGASEFRYRIALIHHHLLPLPDRPQEFDTKVQRISRIMYDEAFKLLGNAGLTTDILLKGSVELVLHGHEHKEFAASINYHDPRGVPRMMAVVGGPAASTGFQVIYFRRSGDVDLVRYELRTADYEPAADFKLWTYEDWKRLQWERRRREHGYYERVERSSDLSETGDFCQTSDVTNIFGGVQNAIDEIRFASSAEDPKFGRVALVSLYDKQRDIEISPLDLPRSGPSFNYPFRLTEPATYRQPHRGFRVTRTSGNNYALTQEDAKLRKPQEIGPSSEFLGLWYQYPAKRIIVTHVFPPLYAPVGVEVTALLRSRPGMPQDTAETLRARRKMIYRRDDGIVVLDLDWVTPDHEYRISWQLPTQEQVFEEYNRATIAQSYVRQLISLPTERKVAIQTVLKEIRKRCFDLIAEMANVPVADVRHFHPDMDSLSLWAFDADRGDIRVVAATLDDAHPFWNASLQYGAGVRGRAMRRGTTEFYRKAQATGHTELYFCFDGSDHETYLLSVPIPLPLERAIIAPGVPLRPARKEASIGQCWMVACVGSVQNNSLLHHLLSDVEIRDKVADRLLFEIVELVEQAVAGYQQ